MALTRGNKKVAIAMYARGDKNRAYMENAANAAARILPEIDVIEIDPSTMFDVTKSIPYQDRANFHKLAVVADPKFDDYDRVVYIDSDTEIVSREFMKVFDVYTSEDGLAAVPDLGQRSRIEDARRVDPGFNRDVYVNTGMLVFDLWKINREEWKSRLKIGIRKWLGAWLMKKTSFRDQTVVNTEFNVNPVDPRFSWFGSQHLPEGGAWMIHYCGSSKRRLDLMIASANASQHLDYPVDVLYAVGQDTADIDFAPLKWSLRSLGMHASGMRNVIVVSEKKPKWLSDNAIFVEFGNMFPVSSFKATNITMKIINGARAAGSSRQFLYSSDDHYLVNDVDFREYPRYYTGPIKEFVGSKWFSRTTKSSRNYWRGLAKCEEYLEGIGLNAWRKTCLHLNTWFCSEYLDEAERITLEAHEHGVSMSFNMLFNALFERDHPDAKFVKFWGVFDHKAVSATDCNMKDLPGVIGFTTRDGVERDPGVVEWMEKRYPVKSIWEK